MTEQEYEVFAKNKIKLYAPEFKFKWNNRLRMSGACNFSRKIIFISKKVFHIKSTDFIIRTLLHEIGHAIAGYEHGHDEVWLNACEQVGLINAKQKFEWNLNFEDDNSDTSKLLKVGKYALINDRNNELIKVYFRKPKKVGFQKFMYIESDEENTLGHLWIFPIINGKINYN